jgi:hypothetical protein
VIGGRLRECRSVGGVRRGQGCEVQQKCHRCDQNAHKSLRGLEGAQHQQIDCCLLAGDGLGSVLRAVGNGLWLWLRLGFGLGLWEGDFGWKEGNELDRLLRSKYNTLMPYI